MRDTSKWAHPQCFVCGRKNHGGLGLKFKLLDNGVVETEFDCVESLEGYEDILHGGIISSLLDGAMTHRLFANGVMALTAELLVRFRHKVNTGTPLKIQAWITHNSHPLYVLESQIIQDEIIKVTGKGKFMAKIPETNGG